MERSWQENGVVGNLPGAARNGGLMDENATFEEVAPAVVFTTLREHRGVMRPTAIRF